MPKRNPPSRAVVQTIADSSSRVKTMKEHGISPTTFYRYCKIYGIEFRNADSSYKLTPHEDELVQMMLDEGFSARKVAEKMDVCVTSILKRRNRHTKEKPPRGTED